MRPKINPNQNQKAYGDKLWRSAMGRKQIELTTEEEVFSLTPEEAEKCRFSLPDKKSRNAECTVHTGNFSHGIRLHPPHLYTIRNGKVFYRESIDGEWIRWYPSTSENLKRFEE